MERGEGEEGGKGGNECINFINLEEIQNFISATSPQGSVRKFDN